MRRILAGQVLKGAAGRLQRLAIDRDGTLTAQVGFGLHHQLIARQGDNRRAARRLDRHVRDGLHFVWIEVSEHAREVFALFQIAARAIDRDADPIYLVIAQLRAN